MQNYIKRFESNNLFYLFLSVTTKKGCYVHLQPKKVVNKRKRKIIILSSLIIDNYFITLHTKPILNNKKTMDDYPAETFSEKQKV